MTENVDLKTDVTAQDEVKQTENEQETKTAENTAAETEERKEEKTKDEETNVEKDETTADDEGKEKTFTQEDVDKIVSEKTKELQDKLDKNDRKEMLNKKGIKNDFAEFVEFEVMKNVNDETNFEKALEMFIEKNPQYADAKATGISMSGKSERLTGVEEEFYKKNPNLNK